jgi:hypothetical protein
MGVDVFEQLHQAIINQLEHSNPPTDSTTGGDKASPELTKHTSEAEAAIEAAVDSTESEVISDEKQTPLSPKQLKQYWVIQHAYS